MLYGQMLLGFTGIAQLDGRLLDEWVLDTLISTDPGSWPRTLTDHAIDSLGRIHGSWKRKSLTFHAVGFAGKRRGVDDTLVPVSIKLTNSYGVDRQPFKTAAKRFQMFQTVHPAEKWANLTAVGQRPHSKLLGEGERILRRANEKTPGSPLPAVELLARLVSGIAIDSPTVSSACLVTVLPEKAFGKAEGSLFVGGLSVADDVVTSINFTGTEDQRIAYMPSYIVPGGQAIIAGGFFGPEGERPPPLFREPGSRDSE